MISAHDVRRTASSAFVLLLFALVAFVGCGGLNQPQTGTVTGSVSVHGEPLTTGTVNLYSKQTAAGAQAMMDTKGEFKVHGEVPTGTYVVYLQPSAPPMPVMEDGNNPAPLTNDTSDFPDVPAQYLSADKSDVMVEVESGENVFFVVIPP